MQHDCYFQSCPLILRIVFWSWWTGLTRDGSVWSVNTRPCTEKASWITLSQNMSTLAGFSVPTVPKSVPHDTPYRCMFADSTWTYNVQLMLKIQLFLVVSSDIEDRILEFMVQTDRGWECSKCHYSTFNRKGLMNHIESKHVNIGGVSCSHCPRVCPTRHALLMHVRRQHTHVNNYQQPF